MAERRTIGQILMGLGRITEDDCAKALEYQRDNGGYFGEALVGCGFLTAEELEWGLASQFDLPSFRLVRRTGCSCLISTFWSSSCPV